MAHDVFISHSSKDKTVADATCAWLEAHGIRCWIAPRDIRPGARWGTSIIQSIRASRVMVLIFSSHANASDHIKREVERAVSFGVTVIPMRVEDVLPDDDLEYFLSMPHWLDAFSPPLESHLDGLVKVVNDILSIPVRASKATMTEPEIEEPVLKVPEASPEPVSGITPQLTPQAAPEPAPPQPKKSCVVSFTVILAALAVVSTLGWYFGIESPRQVAMERELETQLVADAAEKDKLVRQAQAAADEARSLKAEADKKASDEAAAEKKAKEDEAAVTAAQAAAAQKAKDDAAAAAVTAMLAQLDKEKAALETAKTAADASAAAARGAEQRARAAAAAIPVPTPSHAGVPVAGRSWTNSLGMKFVPAGTDGVLFCIWDVRVKDYAAFVDANPDYDAGTDWKNPGFTQTENDPVVNVTWNDATKFCQWLTTKEQPPEGTLGSNQIYRLPTDAEWSRAVGLIERSEGTPADKNGKIKNVYPWGPQQTQTPPAGAGNYCGEEIKSAGLPGPIITGYNDHYVNTSPVGSFKANNYGLFDMGGNVWQWCEDQYDDTGDMRVLRGASWTSNDPKWLLSSSRDHDRPSDRARNGGFRVVLVVSP